jgi:hypothetical protein
MIRVLVGNNWCVAARNVLTAALLLLTYCCLLLLTAALAGAKLLGEICKAGVKQQ